MLLMRGNLLIAGGTGLVGKELGKKLVQEGYRVFVLTRNPEKSLLNTPYSHQPFSWEDLNSPKGQKIFCQLDGIINLAGANIANKRWTKKYKKELWSSRVDNTKQLVSACNDYGSGVRCFISASATGYYGESIEKAHEERKSGRGFLASLCGAWEEPLKELKTRFVIFRLGVVFSEKGGFLSRVVPVVQKGLGGPIGGGQQIVSWIDMEDLINMFLFALKNNISGIFNAVSPFPVTNRQLIQTLARQFQTKARLSVPALLLRAFLGEMSQVITESQNVSCEKIQRKGFQFQYPRLEDSLRKRLPLTF